MSMLKFLLLSAVLIVTGCSASGRTTGEVVDDTTTQSAVKAKLMGNDFMKGLDANIEMHKGIVQLGGFVDDQAKANEMAERAATVDGVTKVDNQLHAKQGERSAGQAIDDGVTTSRVKAGIADSDLGHSIKINVDTYNGVVLLTGFVDAEADKQNAGAVAAKDANTRSVINGIYVAN